MCWLVLQSDIAALYIKVGVKNIGTVFLHTDAQIPDERFLVLINDMLASGSEEFFCFFFYFKIRSRSRLLRHCIISLFYQCFTNV